MADMRKLRHFRDGRATGPLVRHGQRWLARVLVAIGRRVDHDTGPDTAGAAEHPSRVLPQSSISARVDAGRGAVACVVHRRSQEEPSLSVARCARTCSNGRNTPQFLYGEPVGHAFYPKVEGNAVAFGVDAEAMRPSMEDRTCLRKILSWGGITNALG